ncbi:MAG: hypothetical protein ACRC17_02060 [Culicoidibacterales bacterium]
MEKITVQEAMIHSLMQQLQEATMKIAEKDAVIFQLKTKIMEEMPGAESKISN